jgi:hypothetical protein
MHDPNLAIINLQTGEITPLDEWLRDHRRRQLQLILAQLGQVPTGVGGDEGAQASADEMARALFARRETPG